MDSIELEFTEEALRLVAQKAIDRKTGARGLRSILEHVLLEIMYDLPALQESGVTKIMIEAATIDGAPPVLTYGNSDSLRTAQG
jgi:ATP-dependent Clp protease ATP-binding subunit ClpX